MSVPLDNYYHKTLSFRLLGKEIALRSSQDLFSSFEVDKGTRLLLRSVISEGFPGYNRILDMGCGYGPIGLMLKKHCPRAMVEMVDRDALAVAFARRNALDNGLEDVSVYASLGYDDVPRSDYDLIVSNIPGKAGAPVIASLLSGPLGRLSPGGLVAVVVVSPLAEFVEQTISGTNGASIVYHAAHKEHHVFHYHFETVSTELPALSSMDKGVYYRDRIDVQHAGIDYTVQTAWGLPEYDSLHRATALLLDALGAAGDIPGGIAFFNPGQGHAAVYGWKLLQPERCVLFGRDILALRTSAANLALNGCSGQSVSVVHDIDITQVGQVGAIAGVVREDEGRDAYLDFTLKAAAVPGPGGLLIMAGSSTVIGRIADYTSGRHLGTVISRRKSHGCASLVIRLK